MEKKYRVKLSAEEREELKAMVSKGRSAACKQTHARIPRIPRIPRFHGGRLCCWATRRKREGL